MKNYVFFLSVFLFIISCKQSSTTENNLIDYKKMDYAMYFSFAYSDIVNKDLIVSIYPKFENKALKDITNVIYNSFDAVGYDINDSINKVINSRNDLTIPNVFFDIESVKYEIVTDTVGFEKDFVIMSEPIFIKDSSMLFFTISCSLNNRYYGFYLQKNKDSGRYDLVSMYDWQKDMLFDIKEP